MVQALYVYECLKKSDLDHNLDMHAKRLFVIMKRTSSAGFCILYSTRDPVFRRHS